MSLRHEFVTFALCSPSNISELCRRFGISRKTGYKWINRYVTDGYPGLADRSRRPKTHPTKTDDALEKAIMSVRHLHPAWGGRKIRKRLQDLGWQQAPAPSTITAILKRKGCIDPRQSVKHTAYRRFEAEAPNDLWQMDFKGHFAANQGRCHPLTVLDDHSRYSLGLQACTNEQGVTVKHQLIPIFQRYGMPSKMLMDNGSPWGSDKQHVFTPLTVWLIRHGISIIHSRPFHPQTLGKDERFHRTFKAEVGQYCVGLSLEQCQAEFNRWRHVYNSQRPHEALDMQVPAACYRPSPRQYQENLPPIDYGPDDQVRKVYQGGWISFRGKNYSVPKAFRGQRVAVRPTETNGLFDVYFGNQKIAHLNLKEQVITKRLLPMSPNTCYP
jgi:transposase InsO family protein